MPSTELASLFASRATLEAVVVVTKFIREQWKAAREVPGSDPAELADALVRYEDLVAARNAYVHATTVSTLHTPSIEVSETTMGALVRTQDAYLQRTRTQSQHVDAIEDHQSKYISEWQQRVKSHSERSHEDMLTSLWASGLSWRDIARLLEVSVAAVQKWRSGEKMTPKNFARLRDFVAAYDMVAAHKPGIDIASWLYVPIVTDAPVTPLHFWSKGDAEGFFEYALGDLAPEAALDRFDPDWRARYRDDGLETFEGADGNMIIATKSR